MQIVVLGCHRSGTSAVTRLINMMGAYVGRPESMKAPNKENVKGFWENDEVVDLNKLLLSFQDCRWDRALNYSVESTVDTWQQHRVQEAARKLVMRLDSSRPWVTKDPRMCLTFPFWRQFLEVPVCPIVIRRPMEVALSLNRRNNLIPLEVGLALWEKYSLEMLRGSLGLPRFVIHYSKVIEEPFEETRRIFNRLGELGVRGLDCPSEQEVCAFISPSLSRERSDSDDLLNSSQKKLAKALESGSALKWAKVPKLSKSAQKVLTAYEASVDATPDNLLAQSEWNFGEIIRVRGELIKTKEQLRKEQRASDRAQVELEKAVERRKGLESKLAKTEAHDGASQEELKKLRTALKEKGEGLRKTESNLRQKDVLLESREVLLAERRESLEASRQEVVNLKIEIAERKGELKRQKALLEKREGLLAKNNEALENSRKNVTQLKEELAGNHQNITQLEEALANNIQRANGLEEERAEALESSRSENLQLQQQFTETDARVRQYGVLLSERDKGLAEKTAAFSQTRKYLEQNLQVANKRIQGLEETLHEIDKKAKETFAKQVERNEDSIRLLFSWIEEIGENITQIEEIGWWRLGMTLRNTLGILHIRRKPSFAGTQAAAILASANDRRKSTLERLRNIEKEKHPEQLFQDHIRLFSQWIEQLYGMADRMERTTYWRVGVRLRRLAGLLYLKKHKFELPTERAKATFMIFQEWKKKAYITKRFTPKNRELVSATQPQITLPKEPRKQPSRTGNPSGDTKTTSVFHREMANVLPDVRGSRFEKAYLQSEKMITEMTAQNQWPNGRPLVSVIMPAYNRADIISDAIQSVCDQTYPDWELLVCDDGSDDDTEALVAAIGDTRIVFLKLDHQGAAKARNSGLEQAKGEYIAYLDSDNIWHPGYLDVIVGTLANHTGRYAIYSKYVDVVIKGETYTVKKWNDLEFNYEKLSEKNFIDLNSFVHRASAYHYLGGFTNSLARQQDWDLILKHTYLRDPLYVGAFLTFYRRNELWNQLTITKKDFLESTRATVLGNLKNYYENGLPVANMNGKRRKVTILSWDICRNHFSKAYNLAESLARSEQYDVQLLGFRFFETDVFEPYQGEEPSFETVYIDATEFPDFEQAFIRALKSITGDVVYCVKPRLASLGLGLMANFHFGKRIIMEANDSEVHVTRPQKDRDTVEIDLDAMDMTDKELLNPYSLSWSQVMDELAKSLPWTTTHNKNLDAHYGAKSFYIRNLKDEKHYDPARYDRDEIRAKLGFAPTDRVILFGGLLRKHKGIYELIDLVKQMGDERYKVLFVASRVSPDQKKIAEQHSDSVTLLPPQGRNYMAQINYASDLVILWLDPGIPASHYQMPYKFTDAIAMKVPVIANDISDLGDLGRQGYLRLVDFGNIEGLQETVADLFDKPDETKTMVEASRKLYLRQFSYQAAKNNFDMVYDAAMRAEGGTLPAAQKFSELFARFHQVLETSKT